MTTILPTKDKNREHPIPHEWRATLTEIANCVVRDDYSSLQSLPFVAPPSAKDAKRIRGNVASYGETFAHLHEDTWQSSVSQRHGTYWELLIDLWTVESGRSDLVLFVHVFESSDGFRFEIDDVHVPLA